MDLPEGPATLMFTDIEGSTALRTTLGDTETDALFHEHDELVREQIEEHKGRDQKTALGGGFLAVFVSTRRALACAIGIQRALDSFNLNRVGRALRVRVGLNTGEVSWQDGQLSGEAVHGAARVCAEGHCCVERNWDTTPTSGEALRVGNHTIAVYSARDNHPVGVSRRPGRRRVAVMQQRPPVSSVSFATTPSSRFRGSLGSRRAMPG